MHKRTGGSAPSYPKRDYSAAQPAEVAALAPESRQAGGVWGAWLSLSTPPVSRPPRTAREREYVRRSRLLSTLQFAAIILTLLITPRGFLPVLDLGTLLGVAVFAIILVASIILNRLGYVTAASAIFVGGLALAIGGSQLATATGTISFQDLAGYDLLVIPLLIAGILLPSRASIWLWIACAGFVVGDLALAPHGANLDAFLPAGPSPFVRIYPVAIYPVILTAIVSLVSWLSARSVARALEDADRAVDLERANAQLAEQKQTLEEAIAGIQQVHARVANGDLAARARTVRGDPLLPLAVSLNLTLDRLARTTSTATQMEEIEREVATLSDFLDELVQARLSRPAPIRQVRYLSTLAANLDQLRTGIAQTIRQAYILAERLQEQNASITRNVQELASTPPPAQDALDRLTADLGRMNTRIGQLQQYLGRFL